MTSSGRGDWSRTIEAPYGTGALRTAEPTWMATEALLLGGSSTVDGRASAGRR